MKYCTSALIGILASQLTMSAPAPKLIREVNLKELIREPGGLLPSSHAVIGLVLSPDENWVGVGVGLHRKKDQVKSEASSTVSHVIVLPFKGPLTRTFQIDSEVMGTDGTMHWSPKSDFLGIGNKVYTVPGGELWRGGRPDLRIGVVFGFLDPEHGLA